MLPIYPILDAFWMLRTLDAAVLDVAYFGCCVLGPFDGLPPTPRGKDEQLQSSNEKKIHHELSFSSRYKPIKTHSCKHAH